MFSILRQMWEPGRVTIIRLPNNTYPTYAEATKNLQRFRNTHNTTYEVREMKNGN